TAPVIKPLSTAGMRMTGDNMPDRGRGRRNVAPPFGRRRQAGGIGNTGLADAKDVGKITWMSLPTTWVFTGAAPWFCPLTNLVGPYGMTWPENVELSIAAMIFARSALPARSIVSASSSTAE